MKTKIVSAIFIFFLGINCLHGQTVRYTYDASGNRDSTITVEQLRSGSVLFPVVDFKNMAVDNMKEKPIEGELSTLVYPNPNRGLIKIDISNMLPDSKTEARIYDLSGMEQMVKRNFDSSSEIDISKLKDGIYILRIKINETIFDWKVVKSQ
jgi:hypothetical protein